VEHTQKWEQFHNTQPSTKDTTNDEPLLERDFWVVQNLNNKGRVYGFGSEGLVMRQQSRQSMPARSSSVNNYDACEMAQGLNGSVTKAAEEARQEELRCKIEDEVTQKLSDKFTKHLADAKASLEKTMKKQIKKSQTKLDRILDFFKRQRTGSSSTVPPDISQFEEETDDEKNDKTPNLGDDSTHP